MVKKTQVATDFKLSINHNLIKQTDNLRYLGVYLDNELSWKSHFEILSTKLLKICGIIYKLIHYVSLSTLKSVYFSLFHSQLQYSLLNWGRATKTHLHKLEIPQNKIIRDCYFRSRFQHSILLYSKLGVLKLDDMIKMELAKFIFKFKNQMLPSSFNNYFINLNQVHKYNTKISQRILLILCWFRIWKENLAIYLFEHMEKYPTRISPLLIYKIQKILQNHLFSQVLLNIIILWSNCTCLTCLCFFVCLLYVITKSITLSIFMYMATRCSRP